MFLFIVSGLLLARRRETPDVKKRHLAPFRRVKSLRGTQFRIWATQTLKSYLLHGYAVTQRIENLERRVEEHDRQIGFSCAPLYHDRLLIVDHTVYHIGASLKDLGKKLFAFTFLSFKIRD